MIDDCTIREYQCAIFKFSVFAKSLIIKIVLLILLGLRYSIVQLQLHTRVIPHA